MCGAMSAERSSEALHWPHLPRRQQRHSKVPLPPLHALQPPLCPAQQPTMLHVVILLALATSCTGMPSWYTCNPSTCSGTCVCASDSPPGGLAVSDMPQVCCISALAVLVPNCMHVTH